MYEEDWKPVVLKKNNKDIKKLPTEKVNKTFSSNTNYKLDNNGDFSEKPINKISHTLKTKIIQARNAKGITQTDLASKIGVQVNVVKSYENATAIPDPKILNSMSRVLGVPLNKNM